MELDRIPKPGEIYKHFKNKLYQIITIATHSETNESMVVYQALYGTFKTYIRSLEMFVSEVDHDKYPDIEQQYRFQRIVFKEDEDNPRNLNKNQEEQENTEQQHLIEQQNTKEDQVKEQQDIKEQQAVIDQQETISQQETFGHVQLKLRSTMTEDLLEPADKSDLEEGQINPLLLDFLDARSYEEKLSIIVNKKKYITDKLLNDMAVSLDVTVDEGDIDERIRGFVFCLQTLARFDNRRLR